MNPEPQSNLSKVGYSLLVVTGAVMFFLEGPGYFKSLLSDWRTVVFYGRGFEFRGVEGVIVGAAFLILCLLFVVGGFHGLYKSASKTKP